MAAEAAPLGDSEFHIMHDPTAAFIEGGLQAPSQQREGHFQQNGRDGNRSGA